MSKIVYKTKRAECEGCEDQMLIDVLCVDNVPRNDPKIRHTKSGEKWQDYINCECGKALSPSSRHRPNGYDIIDHFVDVVKANQLEGKEPDFSSLF